MEVGEKVLAIFDDRKLLKSSGEFSVPRLFEDLKALTRSELLYLHYDFTQNHESFIVNLKPLLDKRIRDEITREGETLDRELEEKVAREMEKEQELFRRMLVAAIDYKDQSEHENNALFYAMTDGISRQMRKMLTGKDRVTPKRDRDFFDFFANIPSQYLPDFFAKCSGSELSELFNTVMRFGKREEFDFVTAHILQEFALHAVLENTEKMEDEEQEKPSWLAVTRHWTQESPTESE